MRLMMDKNEVLRFIDDRRDVFDSISQENPFASSAWLLHFIEQISTPDWSFVIAEGAPGGDEFMLLYRTRGRPERVASVGNYYCSLSSPIMESPGSTPSLAGIVDDLRRVRPGVAMVDLAPLASDANRTAELYRAFQRAGWFARRYFCFGNWFLPSSKLTFEDYMEARPSQLRNTWTRKAKRFEGGDGRLELVTTITPDTIEAFRQVYAKSWKKPEPYPEFVPGWARVCAANGWLRLGIAWFNDKPVAAQFWFTRFRRAYIFKLAYDAEFSKLSAGTVLTAFMMRYSLEQDHVVEIDYLTGDDAYKKDWMTSRRERVGIRACNLRGPRGIAAAAVEAIGAGRQRLRGMVGGTQLPGRA